MRALSFLLLLTLPCPSFPAPIARAVMASRVSGGSRRRSPPPPKEGVPIIPFESIPDSWQYMLMDSKRCAQLKCEWRGRGSECMSANFLHQEPLGAYWQHLNDDESEEDFVKRIQANHPVNRFYIINRMGPPQLCSDRRLWCNVAYQHISPNAHAEFFERLRNPNTPPEIRPSLCY